VDKFWAPFIRRGDYQGTDFELKMPTTPWWMSLLGILPVKWVIVSAAVLLAAGAAFDAFKGAFRERTELRGPCPLILVLVG
jgi:hypothetical protein